MRFTPILHSIFLAFVCLEGAEAGFLGAAVRAGMNAGRIAAATRSAAATNFLVQNAARNMRALLTASRGRVLTSARESMNKLGKSLTTTEGRKKLGLGLTHDVAGGAMAGTVAGHVSKDTGSKLRRGTMSDRAAMLSRAIAEPRQEEEVGQPGEAPEGVDQGDWEACFWNMIAGGGTTQISGEVDWVQVEGLPGDCSVVNDKIANTGDDSGAAINCGDGCLRYEGLSPEEFNLMADYLNALSMG